MGAQKMMKQILSTSFLILLSTACYSGRLQIEVHAQEGLTSGQKATVQKAADYWSSLLSVPTVRLPVVTFNLEVGVVSVDGVGGTLAFTGCDGIFENTQIPSGASIWLDSQDVEVMTRNGTLYDAVRHEIAHGLGFGGAWDLSKDWPWPTNVLANSMGGQPHFVGAAACSAYGAMTGKSEASIPLEIDGDAGTYGGHWNKRIFGPELMTGYYSGKGSRISPVTLGAFKDMTYDVDESKAREGHRLLSHSMTAEPVVALFDNHRPLRMARHVTRIHEDGELQRVPLLEYKADQGAAP